MYNQITVVGRWVRDTEITVTNSGTEIMNGSIAVSDPFRKEHTDFIDVVAFKSIGLNTNKFTGKGSKILVSGKLQHNRWEDKDGNKRSKHEIVANQIVFLDSKGDKQNTNNNTSYENKQQQPNQNQTTDTSQGEPFIIQDQDLPF